MRNVTEHPGWAETQFSCISFSYFFLFFLLYFSFLRFYFWVRRSRLSVKGSSQNRFVWETDVKVEKSGRSKINWMTRIRSYRGFEEKRSKRHVVHPKGIPKYTQTDRWKQLVQHLHFAKFNRKTMKYCFVKEDSWFRCEIYEISMRLIFQYRKFFISFFFFCLQFSPFCLQRTGMAQKKDTVHRTIIWMAIK